LAALEHRIVTVLVAPTIEVGPLEELTCAGPLLAVWDRSSRNEVTKGMQSQPKVLGRLHSRQPTLGRRCRWTQFGPKQLGDPAGYPLDVVSRQANGETHG
jgi:hypothetical protein